MGKSYRDPFEEENRMREKQANCSHPFHIKKCSLCNLIISSEHTEETHPVENEIAID